LVNSQYHFFLITQRIATQTKDYFIKTAKNIKKKSLYLTKAKLK